MRYRRQCGLTVVELVVVFAIIAILIGLLVPALMRARESARNATCKNNLHQISIAMLQYRDVQKKVPVNGPPTRVGGWSVEILPFLEQDALYTKLSVDVGRELVDSPSTPRISAFTCPSNYQEESGDQQATRAHYILGFRDKFSDESYFIRDVTESEDLVWYSSPVTSEGPRVKTPGPHFGGYNQTFNEYGSHVQTYFPNGR